MQDDDLNSYDSRLSGFSNISRHASFDIQMEGDGLLQFDLEERLSRIENLPYANQVKVARDPSERIISNIVGSRGYTHTQQVDLGPYLTTPNDSNDPSYTDLVLPYYAVCRQRYHRAQRMMKKQFIKEVREHEAFQKDALDGIRIHREFCRAVFRYPKPSEFIRLTPQQEARLEAIMRE